MITIIKHILTAIFKDGIKKKNYNSAPHVFYMRN